MAEQVTRQNTLLYFVGFEVAVGLYNKEARLLYDLKLVDSIFHQLLVKVILLGVNVNNINVALFISGIQLSLNIIPANMREDYCIRIGKFIFLSFNSV